MTKNQYNSLMTVYDESKSYFMIKNIIIHIPAKYTFEPEYLEYIFACSDLYDYNECVK
jgi:hypothetical protein